MLRYIVFTLGWFGLIWASLQINRFELGHTFCGKWGCGPPTEAILGMHFLWFAVLLPPSLLACRIVNLPWQIIGKFLCLASALGLIGFGFIDYFGINRGFYNAGYVWQRYLLSLASLVDIPIVQVFVMGGVFTFFGKGCPCCQSKSDSTQIPLNLEDETYLPVGSE